MTVAHLIEMLRGRPPDMSVIVEVMDPYGTAHCRYRKKNDVIGVVETEHGLELVHQ